MAIGYHPGFRKTEAERRKDRDAASIIEGRARYRHSCEKCGGILSRDGSCTKCYMKARVQAEAERRTGKFGEDRKEREARYWELKKKYAEEVCRTATRGQTKYCGYVIGKDITCEQVERLYHFIHANYTAIELITMNDKQLQEIAEDNEEEWK
jgi:hypothetical protein